MKRLNKPEIVFLTPIVAFMAVIVCSALARPIHSNDAIYFCNQALTQIEAQNPPGLTLEQYNAAAVQIDEAIAILYDRDGKP